MSEQLGEHVEEEVLGVENPEAQGLTDVTADSEGVEGVAQRGLLNSERWGLVVKNFREAIDRLKSRIGFYLTVVFSGKIEQQPKNQYGVPDQTGQNFQGTELEFVIMVIAVSCVKLLSAHNSTQHTSRKHKV
jgi:hypothetical protein